MFYCRGSVSGGFLAPGGPWASLGVGVLGLTPNRGFRVPLLS